MEQTAPTPAAPRKSRAGVWIAIIFLVLALGFSVVFNIVLGIGLVAGGFSGANADHGHAVDQFPHLDEEWSYGQGDVKVVRIPVQGLIMRQSEAGLFGPGMDPVADILTQIRAATHDDMVRAIILEVDSPGGGITPSDEIYNALRMFRESDEDRRILVFIRDLAASGGYYVSMAADWLIAEPTSLVGSIGVIMQTLNWSEMSRKIGITDTTITSGEHKDLLNPFRDVNEAEVQMLQGLVDDMYAHFVTIVTTSRELESEQLDELTDGRVFSAPQALEHNLIDQLGYWDDAVNKTADLLGEADIQVIRYIQPYSFMDFLMSVRNPLPDFNAIAHDSPRMMYLWRP